MTTFVLAAVLALDTPPLLSADTIRAVWPSDFDRYETLLEIGRAAGHSVRYFDVADSPLLHTIADLARERPGIRVTELAALLNLDTAVTAELAGQVVSGSDCSC